MLRRYKPLLIVPAATLLLQACSYSNYSYRVRPAENYHEECGYAFTCAMISKPSWEKGGSLLITIGAVVDSRSKKLIMHSDVSCKSVNEVDSVSSGFAETNQTFGLLKSSNRYEYLFAVPPAKDGFNRHKKIVLKIYFKGEEMPKIFLLKSHEEQFEYSKLFPGMC